MHENIFYRAFGEGEKVVFLHGFCETFDIWNKIALPLADDFQVITADLPGFGQSPLPSGDVTIENVAANVSNWLKTLTDEKVTLMGHSMGGYIALAVAEKHPDLLKGIGLINSTAFSDDDVKKGNRLKTVEFLEKHGKDTFLDSFVPGLFYDSKSSSGKKNVQEAREISGKTSLQTMISYTLAMRQRPSRIHLLKQKSLPVLFIAGKDDPVIPKDKSQKQMELITEGQTYFLDDTAHMSMIEKPEETARLVKIFINQLHS